MALPPAWKVRRELKRITDRTGRFLGRTVHDPIRKPIYDLTAQWRQRLTPGRFPLGDRVAVFVVHQPKGIAPSVLLTLDHLRQNLYSVLVVSNGPLRAGDRATLAKNATLVLERPNVGYDFGAYRDGIRHLWSLGHDMSRLILMNDSTWFPLRRDDDSLSRMEALGADLAGHVFKTEDRENPQKDHMESHLLMISRDFLHSQAFAEFWASYRMSNDRETTIRIGEKGITRLAVAGGWHVRALMDKEWLLSVLEALGAEDLRKVLDHTIDYTRKDVEDAKAVRQAAADLIPWRDLYLDWVDRSLSSSVTFLVSSTFVMPALVYGRMGFAKKANDIRFHLARRSSSTWNPAARSLRSTQRARRDSRTRPRLGSAQGAGGHCAAHLGEGLANPVPLRLNRAGPQGPKAQPAPGPLGCRSLPWRGGNPCHPTRRASMTAPMTRHLLFLTGTRADFGKLEPLAAAARDAGHRVSFFVTGMHMMDRYGLTRNEVCRMPGVTVHEFVNQAEGDPQDAVLAATVTGFSAHVRAARPDLIVLHGDRIEALAGALVAATNYVRSAHVEGGEVSGTIDEVFRHCNTKLCTHHFVSSEAAGRRVRALGEPEETIHPIGSPELDFHARPSGVTLDEVRARYEIAFADYGIVTFHPVTSEQDSIGQQAADLFAALDASGRSFVVIAPNNDPGSKDIFQVLDRLPKSRFRVLPSMRFAHFSELMKNAACMVGNSSAGVREAPFLGLPSLDIGTRQSNRSDAPSVTACEAADRATILGFLDRHWGRQAAPHDGFGQGSAAERFVQTLAQPGFWTLGLQKAFRD